MQCPNCDHKMWNLKYNGKGVWEYDGPSEWVCVCGQRLGYFCNQPLGVDEVEKVNCEGCKYHPRHVEL